MRFLFCLVILAALASSLNAQSDATATPPTDTRPEFEGKPDIEIDLDLTLQRATIYVDGAVVATSPVSSGRASHPTPIGEFEVIEKDIDHHSNLYGKIVDGHGGVVKSSADAATPVPHGCHFAQAPMKFFLRFDGAAGTHAGVLPGYPASHGCVRMPPEKAKLFYDIAQVGTPVWVHGTPPYHAEESAVASSGHSHESHTSRPARTVAAPAAPAAPAKEKPSLFHWF